MYAFSLLLRFADKCLALHQAFVLSKNTKHYRTSDRGKSWQSFEVPIQPAFVPFPLSFHSDKDNYGMIIYQGTKCVRSSWGWGSVCHDEVRYSLSVCTIPLTFFFSDAGVDVLHERRVLLPCSETHRRLFPLPIRPFQQRFQARRAT